MTKKVQITMDIVESHDERALKRLLSADQAYGCLYDIQQEIFRPARKHGYNDRALQEALDNKETDPVDIIYMLEQKFFEILSEHGVSLDDYA